MTCWRNGDRNEEPLHGIHGRMTCSQWLQNALSKMTAIQLEFCLHSCEVEGIKVDMGKEK